jgi:hypothetical protein
VKKSGLTVAALLVAVVAAFGLTNAQASPDCVDAVQDSQD